MLEIDKLLAARKNASFITIKEYVSEETGEISDYNLIMNFSYKNALEKTISTIEMFNAKTLLEFQAKEELLDGYRSSLKEVKENKRFSPVFRKDKSTVLGLKKYNLTGIYFLSGLVVNKRVITGGTYKNINHRQLTLIKQDIIKNCPISKIRQFKLDQSKFNYISFDNTFIMAK